MFTDFCLRAETEADLKAALPWAIDDEGCWVASTLEYDLDLIGPIMTAEPVLGEEDPETGEREVITPPVFDDGFHANLRCIGAFLPDIDPAFIFHPKRPRRVWA